MSSIASTLPPVNKTVGNYLRWHEACQQLVATFPLAGVVLAAGFGTFLRGRVAGSSTGYINVYGDNSTGKTLTTRAAVNLGDKSLFHGAGADVLFATAIDRCDNLPIGFDELAMRYARSAQRSSELTSLVQPLAHDATSNTTIFTTGAHRWLQTYRDSHVHLVDALDNHLIEINLGLQPMGPCKTALSDAIYTAGGHGHAAVLTYLEHHEASLSAYHAQKQTALRALFTRRPGKGNALALVAAGMVILCSALGLSPEKTQEVETAFNLVLADQYADYTRRVQQAHPSELLETVKHGLSNVLHAGVGLDLTGPQLLELVASLLAPPPAPMTKTVLPAELNPSV